MVTGIYGGCSKGEPAVDRILELGRSINCGVWAVKYLLRHSGHVILKFYRNFVYR